MASKRKSHSALPVLAVLAFLAFFWFDLYLLWNNEAVKSHSLVLPEDGRRVQEERQIEAKAYVRQARVVRPRPKRKLETRSDVSVWDKGVLRRMEDVSRKEVPQIIDAFRRGHVDWHDLIPEHSSVWERFGESKDSKFNFMKLVMKEAKVTDFLTRYESSGLSRRFGTEYGALTNYSSCNLVKDLCGVHAQMSCEANSFCSWNHVKGICSDLEVERRSLEEQSESIDIKKKSCSTKSIRRLNIQGQLQNEENISKCHRLIVEPVLLVHVDGDAEAMFFHWWRFFKRIYSSLRDSTKKPHIDRRSHIIVTKANSNTQFFHYFGLVSDACWRRHNQEVPRGTCFCGELNTVGQKSTKALGSHREADDPEVFHHILDFFGLSDQPQPTQIRIGIISRRRKRFILNEDELVQVALSLGFEVQVLPFEDMTLYEQIAALRMITVLVGIHGSGLNNALFLHRGAALIQLLPYKLNYKGAFANEASKAGVKYFEWAATDKEKSVFHWEFVGDDQIKRAGSREAYLEKGSPPGGAEVYTFWINQDIIVPPDDFKTILLKATANSKLNNEILHAAPSPRSTHQG